jgi:hypothetical protein
MLITNVHPEVKATDGSMNPPYISGWVQLDPNDPPETYTANNVEMREYELAVQRTYEGEELHNWRWPPRV